MPEKPVLKVFDGFCGLKGWSQAFSERGHDVRTLDIEPSFGPTYIADILEWDPKVLGAWRPEVALWSPPCEPFTVMRIGANWTRQHRPKTSKAELGIRLLDRTLEVNAAMAPRWFWVENPVGKMRRMRQVRGLQHAQVTYCQYGEKWRMKPTDLWGRWPGTWWPRRPCQNLDPCHPYTPAGSKDVGTQAQGLEPRQRAKVPYELSLEVCLACERAASGETRGVTLRSTLEEFARSA